MKKFFLPLFAFSLMFLLGGCKNASTLEGNQTVENTVKVVTTFYPLYDFTSKIAGNLVTLENMVPAGVEPHDFEPSPRDMEALYGADLIIMNGGGVDAWIEKSEKDLNKKGIKILKMSDHITLRKAEAHEEEEGEEEHPEEGLDPHFWLDPVLAQQEVKWIQDTLIELLPSKRLTLMKQAAKFTADLKKLDAEYKVAFRSCIHKEAVVSHNAFGYIEDRYGIEFLPISGLSPDEEPSARTLADLATLIKEKGLKIIFFETLATPKLAETLSQEVGASTLTLNPLEGLTASEISEGKDYLSIMRENLKNLKTALECR